MAIRTIAFATYGEIARRPLYYILLLLCAVWIFLSKLFTLYEFNQEINMVREMGMATLTLWGFLVIAITSGLVVTQELEDRTAVVLLSKPILRRDFLLGKYLGLLLALAPGVIFLAGVLCLTLWMMAGPLLPLTDVEISRRVIGGSSPFGAASAILWESFVSSQAGLVLQGTILSFLHSAILAAVSVSLAAFFPVPVSVAAVTLVFILGNLSSYMMASVEKLKVGALTAAGRAAFSLLPNLGYFNLQTHFSEGRLVAFRYLALASVYAAICVAAVFLVSCSLFRTREVR